MTFVNGPSADTTSHHMLGFVFGEKIIVVFSESPFKTSAENGHVF